VPLSTVVLDSRFAPKELSTDPILSWALTDQVETNVLGVVPIIRPLYG